MYITYFLPFLIGSFIWGVIYIHTRRLLYSSGDVDKTGNRFILTNQFHNQNESISSHSNSGLTENYGFDKLENPTVSLIINTINTLEDNMAVDYGVGNFYNTSIGNINTRNTFNKIDYKKEQKDYIYLYHKDIPKISILASIKITFGYGHSKKCCFPNTRDEFEKNHIKEIVLGRGSSGTVIQILTKCCNSRYALKTRSTNFFDAIFNPGYYDTEIYFAKYFQLNPHPHIIKFYQVYYFKRELWIVSELLTISTLTEINFLNKNYDEKGLYKYIECIFMGIAFLHKNKIIHGDIKTDNIGVDNNDNVKLFDFGLSNKLDSGYNSMATKGGAPAYRPPEYLLSNKDASYQTDWWAFGVVIYFLVENDYPFNAEGEDWNNVCQDLKKNIEGEQFNGFTNDKISDELKDLIRQLLVPDINRRLGVGENSIDDILNHNYFKGKNVKIY